jgi:hypothetical protein
MNDTQLAQVTIEHFTQSQWDVAYALASVDERWYTSELAAALLKQNHYPYPQFRFGSEESYSTLAKFVHSPDVSEDNGRKIPDLTLINIETRTVQFVLEAKIVADENPVNIDFMERNLGGQMRRAYQVFPSAAIYGLVIVTPKSTSTRLPIVSRLLDQLQQMANLAGDNQLNSAVAKFETSICPRGDRMTGKTLKAAYEEAFSGIASDCSQYELQTNDAAGELDDAKDDDGVSLRPTFGTDMAGMITSVHGACERVWKGCGRWTTNGIESVPHKSCLISNQPPYGIAGLGIGLWKYAENC